MHPGRKLVGASCALMVMVVAALGGLFASDVGFVGAEAPIGPASPPPPELVRELPELRTQTSRTFEASDGSRVTELFTSPLRAVGERFD